MKHIQKGNEFYHKGCYVQALENYFQAHEQFVASDQVNGIAMSLNNIGNVYRIIGDMTSALLYFDNAYDIYTHLQDNEGRVHVLSNKIASLLDNNELSSAEASMGIAERLASSNRIELSALQRNKAILHIKKKEYDQAKAILNPLLKGLNQKNLIESAAIYATMGYLMAETQQYREAIGFFEKALTADQQSGYLREIADVLTAMGFAYNNLTDYLSACEYYQRSVKVYALMGNRKKVDETMERLNEITQKAECDITLTRYFIERWLAGEGEGPCE